MEILGSLKTYEWGNLGLDSEVARLMQDNSPSFVANVSTPYAELWLGDHPSGPSKLKETGEELAEAVSRLRGSGTKDQTRLPFLFKVLSVRKALSIQIHPNKAEAEQLHREWPDIYKDPNHKPELAIALTPFQAMCGFRPYEEIHSFCELLPPLAKLLGEDKVEHLRESEQAVKDCYQTLMTADQGRIEGCISQILENHSEDLQRYNILETFQRINHDFPGDGGVLCLFFFNLLRLEPGEAIFLPANEIHAYLQGDCVECMACSDNVIRAGLTPKYKDIATLIRLLNYKGAPGIEKVISPLKKDAFLEIFSPTVSDFAVAKLQIPAGEEHYRWTNGSHGSIILVVRGTRVLETGGFSKDISLKRGSTVFIPSECKDVDFGSSKIGSSEDFVAYLAMYNDFYESK